MPEGVLAPSGLTRGVVAFEACPKCNTAWSPTLWVVIDLVHNPELLELVEAGTLFVFECPSCSETINGNAPVLVVRDREPRLIFSPSPGTKSIEDHNQLVHCLATLKAALSALWADSLIEEVVVVPRRLLPIEVKGDGSPEEHEMVDLIEASVEADTSWKQQYLLTRYRGLFESGTDAFFGDAIRQAQHAGDKKRLEKLLTARGLVASCLSVSAEVISELLPRPAIYVPGTQLNTLLPSAMRDARQGDKSRSLASLVRISRLISRNDDPLLWAEVRIFLATTSFSLRRAAVGASFLTSLFSGPRRKAIELSAFREVAEQQCEYGPWLERQAHACACLAELLQESLSAEDRVTAAGCYERAADVSIVFGRVERAVTYYDTAGDLFGRVSAGRKRDVRAAMRCFQTAAALIDRKTHPSNWAAMQFNIGNAYLGIESQFGAENATRAMQHLYAAAKLQKELGETSRLAHTTSRMKVAHQAQLSGDPRNLALSDGVSAFQNRNWESALDAYKRAIALTEKMLSERFVEAERRAVFSDFGTAYSAAAYACLRLGRIGEAIQLLEEGRARSLSEEFEAFEIVEQELSDDLLQEVKDTKKSIQMLRSTKFIVNPSSDKPGVKNLTEQISRDVRDKWSKVVERVRREAPYAIRGGLTERELIALAPEGGALVLPVFSVAGCCIMIVTHAAETLESKSLLWIDSFSDNDLMALLSEWSQFLQSESRSDRRHSVGHVGNLLWQRFVFVLNHQLGEIGITAGAQIVILPQGGLGTLPIAAAGPGGGLKTSLIDSYAVSYAPSAFLLSVMKRRARKTDEMPDSLLAMVDPQGELKYGVIEGGLLSQRFENGRATIFTNGDANSLNLRSNVIGKKYVHFCCHGFYASSGGQYSGLHLAHDALTSSAEGIQAAFERRRELTDFFHMGQRWIVAFLALGECRVVTLSACESGRMDETAPDEFLGLPAAFLRAGAACVISTLWRVDDVATMLLIRKLYEGLVACRLRPSTALREAQLWVREATNLALADVYMEMLQQETIADSRRLIERHLREHSLKSPAEKPFSDPYYWAAFFVVGSE